MKKNLFFLLIAVIAAFALNAQSLELYHNGELLTDTVTVTEYNADFGEMAFEAIVKNNTDRTVNLYVARNILEEVDSTTNYFCWPNTCLPSDVDTSYDALSLNPGQSSSEQDFAAHYSPMGHQGITVIKYTFYDGEDANISVSVVVKFDYNTSGINDNEFNNVTFSDAYPNPAKNHMKIDYKVTGGNSAVLNITNVLGRTIKRIALDVNSTGVVLDISDLTPGLYFYSLKVDNNIIATKKLIVK